MTAYTSPAASPESTSGRGPGSRSYPIRRVLGIGFVLLVLLFCGGAAVAAPFPLLDLGQEKLDRGDAKGAVADLKDALDSYKAPEVRAETLLALSRAHRGLGEVTQARAALELILREGPDGFKPRAQYEKARVIGGQLIDREKFMEVLRSFSRESPITLDFDLIQNMFGYEGGYRLDEVGEAVEAFEAVWRSYPEGTYSPHALGYQGMIEGFLLDKPQLAIRRFSRLIERYPESAPVPTAKLALATLALMSRESTVALRMLAGISKGPEQGPARYLEGVILGYYLGNPERALDQFRLLGASQDIHDQRVGLYHGAFAA